MEAIKQELVSIETVSLTFPRLGPTLIERPQLIHSVHTQFAGGSDVVLIDGEPQIGKTVFLAQFARSVWPKVAYLRVPALQGAAFDPELIRYELGNQISSFLSGKPLPSKIEITGSDLRSLNNRLLRNCTPSRDHFYFVVDGIEGLGGKESEGMLALLSALPFDYRPFRFLVTGNIEIFPSTFQRILKFSQVPLLPFSPSETSQYLKQLSLSEIEETDIYKTTHGNPGYLASVVQEIQNGATVDDVLSLGLKTLPDFLKLQWRAVESAGPQLLEILAAVAFLPHVQTVETLGTLFGRSPDEIRRLLDNAFLLDMSDGSIRFRGEAMQEYAKSRLADYKNPILQRAVAQLEKAPLSKETLQYLPSYLRESGNKTGALAFLSPPTILSALQSTKSVISAIALSKEAMSLAADANDARAIVEYAGIQSLLRSLLSSSARPSELKALVAVKDSAGARRLIDAAFSVEQRCKLLGAYVSQLTREELPVPDELKQEIDATIRKFEPPDLNSGVLDLIGNLIIPMPDTAMSLLRRSIAQGADSNSLDWALAYLTDRAFSEKASPEARNRILLKISDEFNTDLGKRVKGLGALLSEKNATEALQQHLASLESTEEKVFLGRIWVSGFQNKTDAARMAVSVIKNMITDASYSPNASVYFDFSTALDGSIASGVMEELAGVLEAQSPVIKRLGPTVDYFRMRAELIRYKYSKSAEAAIDSLLKEADAIAEYKDVVVRGAALACMYATVLQIDKDRKLRDEWGVVEFLREPLKEACELIADQTAIHEDSLLPIVESVAAVDIDESISIASIANTLPRRDFLFASAITAYVKQPREGKERWNRLQGVAHRLATIESPWKRSEAAAELVDLLLDIGKRFSLEPGDWLDVGEFTRTLQLLTNDLKEAPHLASAAAKAYVTHEKLGAKDEAERDLARVREALCNLEPTVGRQTIACDVTAIIAQTDLLEAKKLMGEHVRPLSEKTVSDFFPEDAFRLTNLIVRAFSSLGSGGDYEDFTFAKIRAIVEESGTVWRQVRLWSFLVLRIIDGNPDLAKQVVRNHIRPLLSNNASEMGVDEYVYEEIVVDAIPAMWLTTPATARAFLEGLTWQNRDRACWSTVEFLLRGRIPHEPFDGPDVPTKRIHEETLIDAVELISQVREDSTAYILLNTLFRYLLEKGALSRSQKMGVLDRIRELVEKKFPVSGFIEHKGYSLLTASWIAAIRREGPAVFKGIVQEARAIPNASDRAFVLSQLLESIPKKHDKIREELKVESLQMLDHVASVQERWSRIESLCSVLRTEDPKTCKELMENALRDIASHPDSDPDQARDLVDLAYNIDKNWAASLASILDDDPAKRINRKVVKHQSNVIDVRQKLINGKDLKDQDSSKRPDFATLVEGAAKAVGRIHGYHAVDVDRSRLVELMVIASNKSFSECFALWVFYTEALIGQYRTKEQISKYVAPYLKSLIEVFDLYNKASGLHSPISSFSDHPLETQQSDGFPSLLLSEGMRDEALVWIRDWLSQVEGEELVIVEPYLSPTDVELLKLIKDECPEVSILILTGLNKRSVERFYEEFSQAWSANYGDIDPPETEIIIAAQGDGGKCPVHDRWWIAQNGVLTLGTSFNGLGRRKSEISSQPRERAQIKRNDLTGFLRRRTKMYDGQEVRYYSMTL